MSAVILLHNYKHQFCKPQSEVSGRKTFRQMLRYSVADGVGEHLL